MAGENREFVINDKEKHSVNYVQKFMFEFHSHRKHTPCPLQISIH